MTPRRPTRHRWSLTPAGAGVFSLFFPGLLISAVARQPLLVTVSVAAGLLLAANAVHARVAVGRLRVSVTTPPVATVAAVAAVDVDVGGAVTPLECTVAVVPPGSPGRGGSAWTPALAPASGTIGVRPGRRGVYAGLTTRVATDVPLGLVRCTRSAVAPLDHPLHVAPPGLPTVIDSIGGRPGDLRMHGGDPIGIRPYKLGDSPRDVHWPSVAKTGTLLVRDRRPETAVDELRLVVVAPGAEPAGDDQLEPGFERSLARARAVAEAELDAGRRVVLTTAEPGADGRPAPMTEPVSSHNELLCRLARAVRLGAATVPPGTDRAAGAEPHVVVTAEGARWLSTS